MVVMAIAESLNYSGDPAGWSMISVSIAPGGVKGLRFLANNTNANAYGPTMDRAFGCALHVRTMSGPTIS